MSSARHRCSAAGWALLLAWHCHVAGAALAVDSVDRRGPSECLVPRESSLLQVKGDLLQGRAAAGDSQDDKEEGEETVAAQAQLPPGTVDWNGADSVEVSRQEVSGFPAEVLFRVPRDQVGEMNGTHVFFPFGQMMSASFVRDMHSIGSYEYGFARWVWSRSEISAVGKHVAVGAAEKLHTFTHEGAWSTESLDMVREEQAKRKEATDWIARKLRFARNAAVNTWTAANDLAGQMVNASIDPNILADVMAYTKVADAGPSDTFGRRISAVGANLTQKHKAYKERLAKDGGLLASTSTAVNCVHLHKSLALRVTADGFWLPLEKKLVSIRGQVVLAPLQHFGIATGTTMAKFNEEDGSIEIFTGAASLSDIVDPMVTLAADSRHQQKLFVGPADGASRAIPPEGRHPPKAHSTKGARLVKGLYDAFTALPGDFAYLYEPLDKICPKSELEATRIELKEMDLQAMVSGQSSLLTQVNAVRIMTNMIDCSTDYLVTDLPNSHEYGPFEAMVFLHGIIEFGIGVTARGWNAIPDDMFCPSSGCTPARTTTTTTIDLRW